MSTEPIGLVRDLAPKGVMRAQIGQSDIAIWRSTTGVVSAWENRCPHRGMRLSHGFVRGESLACAYHGWHYDCAGTCHYIPAHPELDPPKTITTTIFSVIEYAGVLWVNTAGNASPEKLPNNIDSLRSITLHCDLETAVCAFSTVLIDNDLADDSTVTKFSKQPKILNISTTKLAHAVIILFQEPEPSRTVSHILASNSYSTDELIKLSRWSESVRRSAESKQLTRDAQKGKS